MTVPRRRRSIIGAALVLVALVASGCSDSADDPAADEEATETTATDETTTESTETEEETTTTLEDLTNDAIRTFLEAEHPDAAALVDWDVFSWVSGSGYTATIPAGSAAEDASTVCEALSEIVYRYSEFDAIAVTAVGAEAALVTRDGPTGECAA